MIANCPSGSDRVHIESQLDPDGVGKGSANRSHNPSGADLRDAGIAAVLDADYAIHRGYRRAVEVVVGRLIAAGGEFTADDIRSRLAADVAECMAPNLIGCVLAEQRRAEMIRQTGWRTSARRSRHCGPVRVWAPARAEDQTVTPLRRVA